MSTSHSSSGASAAGAAGAAGAGRGDDSDAEPKTKKQRLAGASASAENEEDRHQKAISLVFGGELYSKLLGYGGKEAILQMRGDDQWRKAMDELPTDDLKGLKLPVVPRPSDAELVLLRGLLTKPLESPSALNIKLGWTLSDVGRGTLAFSPLASNKMLHNLVKACGDEDILEAVANRQGVTSSLIDEFIASDCPPSVFHSIASNPASSGEVLSAILVRLPKSSLPQYLVTNTLTSIAWHCNVNRFDLQFLSRHEDEFVRGVVS